MGNIADEFYDEYYATTCPECKENAVDSYEEKCTHCLLAVSYTHLTLPTKRIV